MHGESRFLRGGAVVRKLKNVTFQASVLGDNVRHGAEAYHSLPEQQFQAKQGLRIYRGESGDWNWMHCFGHNHYIGQSARELYFGIFSFRLKHFGDPQPVVPIHDYHFSAGDHPVLQQEFRRILNIFI